MKVGEKSLQNLRRYEPGENDWRTPEQKHAAAVKGAAASVEARRRKKRLQDAAKWLLMQDDVISNKDVQAKMKALGIEDPTNAEALMLIALRKAASGNVEAMKFVRDTGGEAPKNQVELSGDLDRPVATLDLRAMSEDELLKLAERETGADED